MTDAVERLREIYRKAMNRAEDVCPCPEEHFAEHLSSGDNEELLEVVNAVPALLDRLERAEAGLACTTCGGSPPASGRPCVCGGANTAYAEIDGLRRECMERAVRLGEYPNISAGEIAPLESRLAAQDKTIAGLREALKGLLGVLYGATVSGVQTFDYQERIVQARRALAEEEK
jgi:hypothetical protein